MSEQTCEHPNAEWYWGEAQPSQERVRVPGYCPDCNTGLDRLYRFEVTEVTRHP